MTLLSYLCSYTLSLFFFFNDTATTEIYTLSLHDALPIFHFHAACASPSIGHGIKHVQLGAINRLLRERSIVGHSGQRDRKSTRLNSSHGYISYAVFCLKKKRPPTVCMSQHIEVYSQVRSL